MLVLCRKVKEQILIGDNILLTVLELDEGRVRIGIDAPREINIVRTELLDDDDERVKTKRPK